MKYLGLLMFRVIHGIEVLAKMEKVETTPSNRPVEDIKITAVTIHANPLADEQ
jgi:peptidyl-prolyl cis-trans isomerase-like 3